MVSDFPYFKELFLKERIHFLWEQILSYKRSFHLEKGRNCRESLLDTVVSFLCAYFFQRSGYAIVKVNWPRYDKNTYSGFLTKRDSNQSPQLQRL